MNTKNLHHIPVNLLLFFVLVSLFALPAFAFTSFAPAPTQNTQVLGDSSYTKEGFVFKNSGETLAFSVVVSANSQKQVFLEVNTHGKQAYIANQPENIVVFLENGVLEVINLSNVDTKVEGVIY
jgi:hypothetical protein